MKEIKTICPHFGGRETTLKVDEREIEQRRGFYPVSYRVLAFCRACCIYHELILNENYSIIEIR